MTREQDESDSTDATPADVDVRPIAPFGGGRVGPMGQLAYRLLRGLGIFLATILWRFEVVGRDRIPTVGPFILAPVHRSYVDFLIAAMAVPRRMRFMGKNTLWRGPGWFRGFIEMLGAFPVDRDHPDRQSLRIAESAIESGEPVVMFPEGRRRSGTGIENLHDGPAWVACRQRVPIIPVAIGGSERAMPIGAKMVRPARVKVVIGEPIYPDVPLQGRTPRRVIVDVTDEIGRQLQKLYDEVR